MRWQLISAVKKSRSVVTVACPSLQTRSIPFLWMQHYVCPLHLIVWYLPDP
ncbi:MAG: hypothetical protein J6Y05_10160 [Bacteroidales bacterium]|nr:hypothetical protein [Bacteroidales bacterium]